MSSWKADSPLTTCSWLSPLVRDRMHDDAGIAVSYAPSVRGPAWTSPWFEPWAAARQERCTSPSERRIIDQKIAALADGADVVMTGQQPGYLGGPLYTLLKAATCLRLADVRTAAGSPTVALFWSGDDDDDLTEALDVKVWDVRRHVFLSAMNNPQWHGRRLGALPADAVGAAEYHWLVEQSSQTPALKLTKLWQQAQDEQWTWGALHARALEVVFADQGLLTVSGDDSALMSVADPIITRMTKLAPTLAKVAQASGAELSQQGYHAQISDRSLELPFHGVNGDRRLRFEHLSDVANTKAEDIRCGVLLRSPLQDWLFQPAAVVVGPGERSYLEQLRPVYDELKIARSPLVPRLHLTFSSDSGHQPDSDNQSEVISAADRVIETATDALFQEMQKLDAAALRNTADRTAAKWRGTVQRTLAANAVKTQAQDKTSPWLTPPGGRPERVLPSYWAVALIHRFVDTILAMSGDHLKHWLNGNAKEFQWPLQNSDLEEQA